uniref:C2 domain-containing protein n=1 Tax=Denticeps clupeoides TaxID=299321 RepID=A0AAY4AHP9_9TELE
MYKFELPYQILRLRHLRSIAARNIVNKNGSPLLDTYFTMHLCLGERISRDFYKSEVIRDSLNPTWRSLDFGMLPDLLDTSVSCFVVRIWGGRGEQYQLLIEWKVSLDGLRYTGQQIRSRNPNEIIFGLNDGYYAADFDQKDHSERKKNSLLQVDQSSVRNSYSVFSLLRLHTAQRAIKQTQVTVQNIGREIEEKLRTTAACTERKKDRECMQLRISVLRSELERQRRALSREMELLHKERVLLIQFSFFTERKQSPFVFRSMLSISDHFFLPNKCLVGGLLVYVCPFFVCVCVYVAAKDDGSLAVALGYTAHLVLMISCFLQIPLRYPVIHKGSRSSIKDTITDKLTEKEREFPLYPRGERFQFDYGVYLLNKNIAQLRYQHGLSTPDLRQTLPNLKNFLEHGLLVHCDRHQVSSSIPVPLKTHLSVSETGCPDRTASPEQGVRKRASSEADQQKYKTPPPSCNTAAAQPAPNTSLAPAADLDNHIMSALDRAIDLSNTLAVQTEAVEVDEEVEELDQPEATDISSISDPHLIAVGLGVAGPPAQHTGTMNGSAVPGEGLLATGADVCCSVEQAEEIMGTEATGLGLGARLEDFPCIPVEHAVAVECDEQVLGELDAGFEEFSRRIFALNENMSSFRRPRKNTDK